MDPLNPMASTLDPAIAQIYTQASSIRDSLRERLPAPASAPSTENTNLDTEAAAAADRRKESARGKTKQLALAALEAPDKVRALVAAGRADEAQDAWEMPRRLLVLWKEKGLGGLGEVEACIRDGDAALRGDQGDEKVDDGGD